MHINSIGTGSTDYPFYVAQISNMIQRKVDEIFKSLPNTFGIADNTIIVGYNTDARHHNKNLETEVTGIPSSEPKVKQCKYHFRCTKIPFFRDVICSKGYNQLPRCHAH